MGIITGYEYQSDFARRYFSEGETQGQAQGKAEAVIGVLEARGIDVPEKVRAEIAECTDLDRLATWVRQAATAHSIDDLDL